MCPPNRSHYIVPRLNPVCPSGNTGGVFGIDNATGLIYTVKDLDLTSVGFYVLTVRVTDSGLPPLMAAASVRISLTLSDASKPKFSQREFQAEVKGLLHRWFVVRRR